MQTKIMPVNFNRKSTIHVGVRAHNEELLKILIY